ncbi:MAG: tail fiber protein [bacterium]|nr:tail fiber protein [bacterium]
MKNIIRLCLTGLFMVSVLMFIGCEAGLSSNDLSGDEQGFSFSEMYDKINKLGKLVTPVGMISPFAGPKEKVPGEWLFCNGRAVSRSEYSALFDVIGTAWGNGDGSTTFNLPDLRGMFLRGVSDESGVDPDASERENQNGGNTGDAVGTYQGHAFESHNHDYTYAGSRQLGRAGGDSGFTAVNGYQTEATGDNGTSRETRPVNAAVSYIIKY